jgi:hypothetical protein
MENTTYYRDFRDIVIKGSPLYRSSVVEQLDKIWGTWTGWAVLRAIIDSGKTVTIVPYSPEDEKTMGRRNAFARPTDTKAASPHGREAGSGSDSSVHFSADTWESLPTCSKAVTSGCLPSIFAQNRGPDDLLVHELVHSIREMRGQLMLNPTRTKGYENEEEYFAVLVQNIYASEKGMTILRRDHIGHGAQQRGLSTSEGFLGKGQRPLGMEQLENRLLVGRFVNDCTALCRNIHVHVTAAFNPIGEYLGNRAAYPYDPTLAWGAPQRM